MSLTNTLQQSLQLYVKSGHQQKVEIALKELGDPTASGETEFRIALAKFLLKHKLSHLHAKNMSDTLRVMASTHVMGPKPEGHTFTTVFKKIQKALHI
ncbi:hypothetical protein DXG01_000854 [Tephrocybe rancida]|nr:hypothetical protein DXG01_000854 [Tephrocybe rancida]